MNDPYKEGREAYSNDIWEEENPYDLEGNETAYWAWNHGWREAAEEENPYDLEDNEGEE